MKITQAHMFYNQNHSVHSPCLFCSKPWVDVVDTCFNFTTHVIGNDKAYLPFTPIHNFIGDRIVSVPYTDYTCSQSDEETLFGWLDHLKRQYPKCYMRFRFTGALEIPVDLGDEWHVTHNAVYHRVPVQEEDRMYQRLSSAFRRGIRKAESYDIQIIQQNDKESLSQFYDLHTVHRSKTFGILTHPFLFYEKIYENFFKNNRGFILTASYQNANVSSILVLEYDGTFYYKFGASEIDMLHLRSNNMLFWHLLKIASARKINEVDLGLSWSTESDQGLRRFKASMGGKSYPVSTITCQPACYNMVKDQEARQVLKGISRLLTEGDLDLSTLKAAGEQMFKYFN